MKPGIPVINICVYSVISILHLQKLLNLFLVKNLKCVLSRMPYSSYFQCPSISMLMIPISILGILATIMPEIRNIFPEFFYCRQRILQVFQNIGKHYAVKCPSSKAVPFLLYCRHTRLTDSFCVNACIRVISMPTTSLTPLSRSLLPKMPSPHPTSKTS